MKKNCITIDDIWKFNGSNGVSLTTILEDSISNLPTNTEPQSVIHGDFCFSNILYDFRAEEVKTIDPRGMTPNGEQTIYGDIRYDVSKLSHSILGLYDWIIAGYYHMEILDFNITLRLAEENCHKEIQHAFIKLVEETISYQQEIYMRCKSNCFCPCCRYIPMI